MRWIALTAFAVTTVGFAACSGGSSVPSPTASSTAALSDESSTAKPPKVPQSANPYTLFETLQVRPLAVSSGGGLLFAANTPDNRLEIFRVDGPHLRPIGSVEVGLEPVAVAVRGAGEVWVVNHLSDSVSIVDVGDPTNPRVVNTLLVGDEPRDIVFAGPRHDRAFVTTAHRGQNSPDDPELFAPGVGRADVWVFDANNLGAAVGGQRLTKITLFADTPRALAATPDGKTVYAASFLSGNQTTTVPPEAVLQVYGGTMPGPATITLGGTTIPQPGTGLVVKYRAGPDGTFHWLDPYGTSFDSFVNITLPDDDVFAIDATANPPAAVERGPVPARGNDALQHGRQPEERQGVRIEHRRSQRRALRRAHAGVHLGRRQQRRQPHQRDRPVRRGGHGRQPQYAPGPHDRDGRSVPEPGVPGRDRGDSRRAPALRHRAGLEQARRLRHEGDRGRPRACPRPPARCSSRAAAPRDSRSTSRAGSRSCSPGSTTESRSSTFARARSASTSRSSTPSPRA